MCERNEWREIYHSQLDNTYNPRAGPDFSLGTLGRCLGAAQGEKLFVKILCFRFFNYSICFGHLHYGQIEENGFEITFNYIIE